MKKESPPHGIRLILLPLLLLSLFVSGCATEIQYGKVVNQWVGKKSSQLFWAWNYPNKQISLSDGNTVYIYHQSRILDFNQTYAEAPQYYSSYGASGPTYTYSQIQKLTCTTWFDVDKKTSRIIKVTFKGDLCMAGGLGSDDPIPPPQKKKSPTP